MLLHRLDDFRSGIAVSLLPFIDNILTRASKMSSVFFLQFTKVHNNFTFIKNFAGQLSDWQNHLKGVKKWSGMPGNGGILAPFSAEIIDPGNQASAAEAEQAVPPDDAVPEKRTIPQKIGDDDTYCQSTAGYYSRYAAVTGPLEHPEYRDI